MTFLAPWALWVAGGVSAAVIALHFLASATPRTLLLPTTRFIPDRPASATARAIRFSDLLLLLLRVTAVMLVGLAFARPVLAGARRPVGRVVMVDRSPANTRVAAGDSARAYLREGDLLFAFDSATHALKGDHPTADISAENLSGNEPESSLSAALVAAMRAASSLRGDADSVELVIVSAFDPYEMDAATSAIRAVWPGRIRLVRIASSPPGHGREMYREVQRAPLDDPLRPSLAFGSRLDTGRFKTDSVRIDRGKPSHADTTWTQYGLTLVRWPAALDSSGYPPRTRADTAGAVVSEDGRAVVVAPFARTVNPPPGRVVARWADGTPAATERKMMNGCVRDVAIPLPRAGDLALRESTRRLVSALTRACGAGTGENLAPVPDSSLAALAGTGPLVATRILAMHAAPPGKLTAALLLAALALLLVEPLFRRPRATS